MNQLILGYIETHKDEILNQWMKKMREEADEKVLGVVSDNVFGWNK